ncbi:hypothetical protein N0V90_010872 [Kalmusia sp. IMI 367209]|nr:hypothetical protein N0V90_010872 [Kalmusia sp. IMI 367209]
MGSSAGETVDLTFDSDDEPDTIVASPRPRQNKVLVPLPGTTAHVNPSSTPRPPRPIVPIPGSQSSHGRSSTSTSKPSSTAHPTASSYSIASSSNTAAPNKVSTGTNYVPVFATPPGRSADDFATLQAEKRRKMSSSGLLRKKSPVAKPLKPKFYGVQVGHVPGVYTDWNTVLEQIKGCKGAKQQAFPTREEAQAFVDQGLRVASDTSMPAVAGGHAGTVHPDVSHTPPVMRPSTTASLRQNAKLTANGLPSVRSLNMALKTKGPGMPFAEDEGAPESRRQLHLERFTDSTNGPRAAGSAPKGLAIAQSSADERIVERDHSHRLKKGLDQQALAGTFIHALRKGFILQLIITSMNS